MKSIHLFLLLFCFSLVLTNCSKEDEDTLPVPPEYSMDMDFSFSNKTKSALVESVTVDDTSNFRIARTVVLFWANAARLHTIIPVAAFKRALMEKPVLIDGVWMWTYAFKIGTDEYSASLTAQELTAEDSVTWAMNITQAQSDIPSSFTYFTGKSAKDRTGGWWVINYPNGLQSVPFLKISWGWKSENEGMLRYSNCVPGDANSGAYIEFGKVPSVTFDRYFKIYIKNDPNNTANNNQTFSIEWSNTAKNGKISGNGAALCWDTNYVNDTCN